MKFKNELKAQIIGLILKKIFEHLLINAKYAINANMNEFRKKINITPIAIK